MVLTQTENFHLALLANEAAPGINDLAILLAKAMEHPWVMGKRRPARIVLRNNPQWEELIPHLTQLKIEVELQQELPLWDDAANDYVRKLKASWIGMREAPFITVPEKFDEAFPALVRWVNLSANRARSRRAAGICGPALDESGMVFEGKTGKSAGEALTACNGGSPRAIGPSRKQRSRCAHRQPSQGRRGGGRGQWPNAHKVNVPISAAECHLILETAKLTTRSSSGWTRSNRGGGCEPHDSRVGGLAIATSGDLPG